MGRVGGNKVRAAVVGKKVIAGGVERDMKREREIDLVLKSCCM